MTKYNDIEIQTAKNLMEQGYKWIARNKNGRLTAHAAKPNKVSTYWWSVGYSDCTCDYVPIFQNIRFEDKEPTSIESIVHPKILDETEKKYLSAVIRPFRDKVKYIVKFEHSFSYGDFEWISIRIESILIGGYEQIPLPVFIKGAMYKGMKPDHKYTLKELGL